MPIMVSLVRDHAANRGRTIRIRLTLVGGSGGKVAGYTIPEEEGWWAHLDSNQGPTGYEPVALTN